MAELTGSVLGLLFALLTILIARKFSYQNWVYTGFLPFLPVFYMGFGALAGSVDLVLLELLYGLPFIAAGLLLTFKKVRFSAYIAGICWLIHAGWDFQHDLFFVNAGVWSWYPAFCAVIDGMLGGYLLYLGTMLPQGRIDLASTVYQET